MAADRIRNRQRSTVEESEKRKLSRRPPLQVILDSNFLITPPDYHIDIFEEIPRTTAREVELIVPSEVYKEIERNASRKGGGKASLALTLAEKCKIVEVKLGRGEGVDDAIVRLARDSGSAVATNDRTLRRRLRTLGIPVLSMRGKGRLELHGVID